MDGRQGNLTSQVDASEQTSTKEICGSACRKVAQNNQTSLKDAQKEPLYSQPAEHSRDNTTEQKGASNSSACPLPEHTSEYPRVD